MVESLGTKIKYIRKKYKFTQKQLAEGICTQALISMFESDETIPSSVVLYKIAKKLNVSLDYFFEEARPSHKVTSQNMNSFIVIRKLIHNQDYNAASLIVDDELKNLNRAPNELAFLYWHKGVCIMELDKDNEIALSSLDKAIEFVKDDYELLLSIYNSMAIIFFKEKDYDNAIAIYSKCVDLFDQNYVSNHFLLTKTFFGLSRTFLYAENFNAALEICERGIQLNIEKESLYLLGELIFQKGRTYDKLKDYIRAMNAFKQAKVFFQLEGKIEYEEICEKCIQRIMKQQLH